MLLPQNNERRMFLSETKDQNTELQYKVTVSDLFFELKVLLKEYYVADFSDNIVFIYVVLFLLTQKNYLANAYTSSTIIPNCLPSANFEDAFYDVHVYADKENPSITVNIHNEGIFSEEIICKVPIYSSLSATYTNQISCNAGDTNITPYISFSKKLIKPVDSYLYQEILDTELKSVFVPENIVIIKYTFSSPSAGSISFTTSFESKIFRSFRSHTYESATNRHTINTSTSEEFL